MFIVAGENHQPIETIPYRENEEVYLYKSDEHKFPLLFLLDHISHTFFISIEDMRRLVAELQLAKNKVEIQSAWDEYKLECFKDIIQLETALNSYPRSMRSSDRTQSLSKRLYGLKQHFQRMEQGQLKGQQVEEVVLHIDEVIALISRCLENTAYMIIHNPFFE